MARRKKPEPPPPPPARPRPPAPLAGARLAPFSGDTWACIKCGHRGASTTWHAAGRACDHHTMEDGYKGLWGVERLHRCCLCCGFSWDEACVSPAREIKETLILPVVPSVRRRSYG